jgi:sugar O-acyltransferase (sialic acid O-acetyltransferase NeuD family)
MIHSLRFVLWGSSGHAKVLSDLISLLGGNVVALFDNDPQAITVLPEVPLFIGIDGFLRWRGTEDSQNIHGLAAIGGERGRDRMNVQKLFREHGINIGSLVHPHSSVYPSSTHGVGSQILAQAVVAADAHMGEACIINHCANVDHECILGDGVHLAPAATLCGCVTLGNNVMIGAGAVVLPRLSIGDDTIVGAGSVVTRNLPSGVVAIGSPAKIIKRI